MNVAHLLAALQTQKKIASHPKVRPRSVDMKCKEMKKYFLSALKFPRMVPINNKARREFHRKPEKNNGLASQR
jgi:hypothetical protein